MRLFEPDPRTLSAGLHDRYGDRPVTARSPRPPGDRPMTPPDDRPMTARAQRQGGPDPSGDRHAADSAVAIADFREN